MKSCSQFSKDLDFYNCLTASNEKDCVLNNDPATTFPLSNLNRLCGFNDILC